MAQQKYAFASYPSLRDRVVFITGGGSGIGAAMVEAFASEGAKVAFADIDEAASEKLVESLAGAAHAPLFIPCDLRDIGVLKDAMEASRQMLGPLSVLINNAARDDRHEVDDVTPAYWDEAIAVNLRHQFFAAQAARAQMAECGGGSIINFSSTAWMIGVLQLPIYATAKAGIVGLTKSLACEFGPQNIRVNAIAPGAVVTQRQLKLWYKEGDEERIKDRQCLKEMIQPAAVARLALFLAADDSRMITNQCIRVDAGLA